MARPSFRRYRFAGSRTGGVDHEYFHARSDLGPGMFAASPCLTQGAAVLRWRAKRETLAGLAAKLSPCIVALEACCGADHPGRIFAAHARGPADAAGICAAYVKAQKNDGRDAGGIAGAAARPAMCFVELKSKEQLGMQTLDRARGRLAGERTGADQPAARDLMERLDCRAARPPQAREATLHPH